MVRSFNTGITGLNAHQKMLDVTSNNIANVNTTAYKTQRTLFADLFYQTMRPATNPLSGTLGGTNPAQIGSGVLVSAIDRLDSQGTLEQTGAALDMGVEGSGFFVLSDGDGTYYTRDGSFGVDAQNRLVDKNTGMRVVRYGSVGEPNGSDLAFQDPNDDGIIVPLGAPIPGQATEEVQIIGNLDAQAMSEAPEILSSKNGFVEMPGSTAATAATLLNNLASNSVDYVSGDQLQIQGRDTTGAVVNQSFAVDGTTTLGDLAAAISGAFSGATASIQNGNIVLTADNPGEVTLQLTISDSSASGQVGATKFSDHAMTIQQQGRNNYTYATETRFFDERGVEHHLELTFEKVAENTWDLTATLAGTSGTVIDGEVRGITFDDDGSAPQVLGTGAGDVLMSFNINGLSTPQTLAFNFGPPNEFSGMTQLGASTSIRNTQDGFPPGNIRTVEVDADGTLYGLGSNDQRVTLAQIALATFQNSQGLQGVGNNMLIESVNSGTPELGPGADGRRGAIRGGRLEASNVDLAKEFTQLIIAQRGFSANARTITVTDGILEELINIVR